MRTGSIPVAIPREGPAPLPKREDRATTIIADHRGADQHRTGTEVHGNGPAGKTVGKTAAGQP